MGVFDESLAAAGLESALTTLHPVAAHAVIALRREPNVSHHGNVDTGDRCNGVGHANATFELDHFGARLEQSN